MLKSLGNWIYEAPMWLAASVASLLGAGLGFVIMETIDALI